MKVSDYIVEYLINKGVSDIFGYPGGMVTHLMDSFSKYENQIQAHVCYHEQAASFAACSYAQVSKKIGVAYATSGPGATNMMTGICNAYFDSIPVLFITGQVNRNESKANYKIRQRGFQETDIVNMVKNVTKYAKYVDDPNDIGYYLEKAYQCATNGRKGPVLLDIPMDIFRAEIDTTQMKTYSKDSVLEEKDFTVAFEKIKSAKRPVILLGAGTKFIDKEKICCFAEMMGMPVVTSMLAIDLLPAQYKNYYGFIGAYGSRIANFIVAKSDCVLSLGSRLDVRQVGGIRENFAKNATIIRVDIDGAELEYKVHENEISVQADAEQVIEWLMNYYQKPENAYNDWNAVCKEIREKLTGIDDKKANQYVRKISQFVSEQAVITTDVGQNQVWIAQSFITKKGQQVLFSGGHGAMGYSLPAAIGAYYATKRPIICFNGDGGFQMNIQELEFVRREKLPIKIVVFNNYALGMIRHFQEMYFQSNYAQTVSGQGYSVPDLQRIAHAYEMKYICYDEVNDISEEFMNFDEPTLIEVKMKEDTYVFPKLEFGKPNQDQEPLIDRILFNELMEM